MRKLLAVLVAIFAAAWFATPALARGATTGYIEICKAATGTPALSGDFSFTVNGGMPFAVTMNTCSQPMAVMAGTVKVVEVAHPWFEIARVDYRDAMGVTTVMSPTPMAGDEISIPVTAGDISHATIVHVTDDPVMGTLEICKYPELGVTLPATGTFTFSISSPSIKATAPLNEAGWIDNLAAPANLTVNVGSCSGPISVPAGDSIVTELKTNGQSFVTQIKVLPMDRLAGTANTIDGIVRVHVLPAVAPTPGETMVSFYNSLSTLKVCKAAGEAGVVPLAPFSFTATAAPAPFTLTPAWHSPARVSDVQCHEVGLFAPGSLVTVAEATVPGTAVSTIALNGSAFVAGTGETLNLAGRTISFFIRPGLNEVTFTNMLAQADPLKVCKAGTGLTGTFSFTTSGATGYLASFRGAAGSAAAPSTFTVVPGQCTFVGWFAYDSSITISETAGNLTGVTTTGIYARLAPAPTGGANPDLVARSAVVIIGNYLTWNSTSDLYMAIVNFTNAPAAAGTGTGSGTGTGTGSGTGSSTTAAPTASTQSASAPTKVVAPAKAMKVASARVVTVGHNRYVVVRVNGAAKTARIHVTLIDKNHKVVGSLTRYVATNKAVRVGNLRLSPSVLSVKVSL